MKFLAFITNKWPKESRPKAIQLRYLQTLTEIAGDKSSTIVFPLDLVENIKKALD